MSSVSFSHDSDLVGDVEGVLLWGHNDVGLLLSGGGDEGVHFFDLDVVELFASLLDLGLGGLEMSNKDKSVVIFNSLDGALSRQGVPDDGKHVHA